MIILDSVSEFSYLDGAMVFGALLLWVLYRLVSRYSFRKSFTILKKMIHEMHWAQKMTYSFIIIFLILQITAYGLWVSNLYDTQLSGALVLDRRIYAVSSSTSHTPFLIPRVIDTLSTGFFFSSILMCYVWLLQLVNSSSIRAGFVRTMSWGQLVTALAAILVIPIFIILLLANTPGTLILPVTTKPMNDFVTRDMIERLVAAGTMIILVIYGFWIRYQLKKQCKRPVSERQFRANRKLTAHLSPFLATGLVWIIFLTVLAINSYLQSTRSGMDRVSTEILVKLQQMSVVLMTFILVELLLWSTSFFHASMAMHKETTQPQRSNKNQEVSSSQPIGNSVAPTMPRLMTDLPIAAFTLRQGLVFDVDDDFFLGSHDLEEKGAQSLENTGGSDDEKITRPPTQILVEEISTPPTFQTRPMPSYQSSQSSQPHDPFAAYKGEMTITSINNLPSGPSTRVSSVAGEDGEILTRSFAFRNSAFSNSSRQLPSLRSDFSKKQKKEIMSMEESGKPKRKSQSLSIITDSSGQSTRASTPPNRNNSIPAPKRRLKQQIQLQQQQPMTPISERDEGFGSESGVPSPGIVSIAASPRLVAPQRKDSTLEK